MADRESYLYQAKLAEQAERYDEMVQLMKKIAELKVGLTIEERNLLSVGYKNVIGTRRASWRVVTAIESKEPENEEPSQRLEIIKTYRGKIEIELKAICNDILKLLDDTLLTSVSQEDIEARIFYEKMKADYYRYMCEIMQEGEKRQATAANSLSAYQTAYDIAKKSLPATHPIRLGLALNFSVFYYEILNTPAEARSLAQNAFDNAVKELSGMSEADSSYKDSTLILQLLRDNLTLWTPDEDENEKQEPVEDLEA